MRTQRRRFDPKRILIVLHGSIGDVTRALPLANCLRKGFPRAHLAWSIEPASLPVIQGHSAVDEVIVFDRSRGWRGFWPFLIDVRSKNFDLVLDLQRHFKSGVVSACSGAPHRIGFHRADAKEFNWIFNNLHIDAFGETISKLDHYLAFAAYLGIPTDPIEWGLTLTVDERATVEGRLASVPGPFAVLFVGTRWQSKQWFAAQMARCAEILRGEHQLHVLLLGGQEDEGLAREAMTLTDTPIIDLVGRTSLREAIGIIERATIAIGPDTGLMHIAAAVETPVVSLWGATSPARTGPYKYGHLVLQGRAPCVPCYRKRCTIGRICLQSIDTEQIAEKLMAAIKPEENRHVSHANAS